MGACPYGYRGNRKAYASRYRRALCVQGHTNSILSPYAVPPIEGMIYMPIAQARKAVVALVVAGVGYLLLKTGVHASNELKAAIDAVAVAASVYIVPNG